MAILQKSEQVVFSKELKEAFKKNKSHYATVQGFLVKNHFNENGEAFLRLHLAVKGEAAMAHEGDYIIYENGQPVEILSKKDFEAKNKPAKEGKK